jgi:hypothetical protein
MKAEKAFAYFQVSPTNASRRVLDCPSVMSSLKSKALAQMLFQKGEEKQQASKTNEWFLISSQRN